MPGRVHFAVEGQSAGLRRGVSQVARKLAHNTRERPEEATMTAESRETPY